MPGQTQPAIVVLHASFLSYLMIQESNNGTGQEHVLLSIT